MADDTIQTIVGNLTADPELRFTPSGAAVSNFTIASTPRYFDKQSNEWKDGETLFMRCSIWREAAENVSESLTKGTRVIAQGKPKSRSFKTKEGDNRASIELDVEEIGPSLRFATANVQRGKAGGQRPPAPSAPAEQPWGGQPSTGGTWATPEAPGAPWG